MKTIRKLTHTAIFLTYAATLLSALLLAACPGPLDLAGKNPQAGAGEGVVALRIDGNTARTALPGAPSHTGYDLVFSPGAGNTHSTVNASTTSAQPSQTLLAGTWNVTVTGKIGNTTVSRGTGSITLGAGETRRLNITLSPIPQADGQEGEFSWNIDLSGVTGTISNVMIYLNKTQNPGMIYKTITLAGGADIQGSESGGVYTGSMGIDTGDYTAGLMVMADNAMAAAAQDVHIYQGLTTTFTQTFTGDDFVAFRPLAGTVAVDKPAGSTVSGVTVTAYSDSALTNRIGGPATASGSNWDWCVFVPGTTSKAYFKVEATLTGSPAGICVTPAESAHEETGLDDGGKTGIALTLKVDVIALAFNNPDINGVVTISGVDLSGADENSTPLMDILNTCIEYYTGDVKLDLSGCTGITEWSKDTIGSGKTKITSLFLPDTVTDLQAQGFDGAFSGYSSLASVSASAVMNTGLSTFKNCAGLTSVDFPSLQTISDYAFQNCSSLTSFTLTSGITSINANAFIGCSQLTFNVTGSGEWSTGANGKILIQNDNTLVAYPSASGAVTLPDSITVIGDNAFESNTGLISISAPNVETINNLAFSECTNLTSVNLPMAETIRNSVFTNNSSLTSVELPAVQSIGRSAFSDCNNPSSLTIRLPAVPPSLGSNIFRDIDNNRIIIFKVPAVSDDYDAWITTCKDNGKFDATSATYQVEHLPPDFTGSHDGPTDTLIITNYATLKAAFEGEAGYTATITMYTDADITEKINISGSSTDITLTGSFTVSRKGSSNFRMFDITNGGKLTLNGPTLQGSVNDGSWDDNEVVSVKDSNSSFTLQSGVITGNTANNWDSNAGVKVEYDATFTMTGGTISGNHNENGGGVRIDHAGKFIMNGGEISGNTGYSSGGGVFITADGSEFTMNGGSITGNIANGGSGGGGVRVERGTFTYNGGTISGNTAPNGGSGTQVIKNNDGVINGTGGVSVVSGNGDQVYDTWPPQP